MKRKLIRYGTATLIGGLLAFFVLRNYGFFDTSVALERYRYLCDAFTIPGVVLIMVGLLVWISQQGMFDFLSYTGRQIKDRFQRNPEHIRYGDYVLEKKENRKSGGYGFLIITGTVFMAIARVFFALFYAIS